MELIFLNSEFLKVGVVDVFDSLLWIEKYWEFGEFELVSSINDSFLSVLQASTYAMISESDRLMVIENVQIKSDLEFGDKIYIKGRSIESILDRRTVFIPVNLIGNLQENINTLLTDNAINPSDPDRMIEKLRFIESTDPIIMDLELEDQVNGISLYQIIRDISIKKNIGFKITLTESANPNPPYFSNYLDFQFYSGSDRSYSQEDPYEENPYIVFSPDFDNLISSDYLSSNDFYKTVAYVIGEDDGVNPIRIVIAVSLDPDGGSDLIRRELYVDASDIRRIVDEVELNDEEYDALLYQRGLEELNRNRFIESFDGQVNIEGLYKYNVDFYMGDIVQLANEYGNSSRTRLIEITRSQDGSGTKVYPSFLTIE